MAAQSQGAAAGAFAAGSVFLMLCVPVLVAWTAGPGSTVGWGSATAVAASAWLLGLGVSVHAGAATVSLIPLAITGAQVVVGTLSARYLLRQLPGRAASASGPSTQGASTGRTRQAVCDCAAGFVGAYLLVALVLAFACRPAGVHASPLLAVLAAAAWSAACFVAAAVRELGPEIFLGTDVPTGRGGDFRHTRSGL